MITGQIFLLLSLLGLLVVGWLDNDSTVKALAAGGQELNPVVKWLMEFSPTWWEWIKLSFQAAICAIVGKIAWETGGWTLNLTAAGFIVIDALYYLLVVRHNYDLVRELTDGR